MGMGNDENSAVGRRDIFRAPDGSAAAAAAVHGVRGAAGPRHASGRPPLAGLRRSPQIGWAEEEKKEPEAGEFTLAGT